MQLALNRQQRRAMKRSKPAKARTVDRFAGINLLNRARPYEEGEMAHEHLKTQAAFERLRTGAGDEDDFDRVSMLLNVGMIRAESISQDIVLIMQNGQHAMNRMKARYLKVAAMAFDGPGIEAVDYALETYQTIMDMSSPLQMIKAIQEAYKRISAGDLIQLPNA